VTAEQEARLRELVAPARNQLAVFLTGAGISAESGIPTFRGEEGYWKVGSRNYQPQELATKAAWNRMPDELWAWYLYRRHICRAAQPNVAHHALVRLEEGMQDRLRIVTQNVDGLHMRAGNSIGRTMHIHGNIDRMRCANECSTQLYPTPELGAWPKERRVTDEERPRLLCPRCGGRARPHILWFDETYDEQFYSWESALLAAWHTSILVVVGTSGATSLPYRMAQIAAEKQYAFIVINRDPSPFTEMAEASPRGLVLLGSAGEYVPRVVDAMLSA
jgi:NAD-dependent deacetylase